MSTYFTLFIFLILLSFLSLVGNRRQKEIIGAVALISICLFQGLRWRTGTDWIPYFDEFSYANKENYKNFEAGYYCLNYIVRLFTNSYTVFLIVESFLIQICYLKVSKDLKIHNYSIILLYFFSSYIFPVRFHLAGAICFCGYKYIIERRPFKMLLWFFLGSSVHVGVLMALPLYFFVNWKYSKSQLLLLYLICCVIGLLSEYILGNALNVINLLYDQSSGYVQGKLNTYVSEENLGQRSFLSIFISILNGLLFIWLFIRIRGSKFVDSHVYNVLLNMYVLGLSASRLLINAIPYLARSFAPYIGGSFILLFILFANKSGRINQFLLHFAMYIYIYFIYLRILTGEFSDLFVPYYSILSTGIRHSVY